MASFLSQKSERPIWHYKWFQWALGALLLLSIAGHVLPVTRHLLNKATPVLTPVLLGLMLAYVFDPVISWASSRKRPMRRPFAAGTLVTFFLLTITSVVLYLFAFVAPEAVDLANQLPHYASRVLDIFQARFSGDKETASPSYISQVLQRIASGELNPKDTALNLAQILGYSLKIIGTVFQMGATIAISAAVMCMSFFFFSWHYQTVCQWPKSFIPVEYRERTLSLLGEMNDATRAFIKGRMIQSAAVGLTLTIGFAITGTPYYFLLGFLGGVLALLPYIALVVWPVAIIATITKHLDSPAADWPWVAIFIGPTIVFAIAQILDDWVIGPLVQGKSTNLDTLSVLLAVMLGGTLGGLPGMIVGIPVAACLKILAVKMLFPYLRKLAGNENDDIATDQTNVDVKAHATTNTEQADDANKDNGVTEQAEQSTTDEDENLSSEADNRD